MGLPLYRDPDDEQTPVENAASKLDRAAASRRSAIRREPTVRQRESLTTAQGLARLIRDRHRGTSTSQDRTDNRIAQLEAELQSLRRTRLEIVEVLERESQLPTQSPPLGESDQANNNNRDRQLSITENVLEPAGIIRAHLPQPPRESNLRFELSQSSWSPWSRDPATRRTIPSPPHSSGSHEQSDAIPDGPIPDRPILDDNSMPALTEGFAPAHTGTSRSGQPPYVDSNIHLETPPPEWMWERGRNPPLRRVNHTSSRPLPRFDGLWDRRRSPGSIFDSPEEDTWGVLMTEMDPDQGSVSTSFTSTTPSSATQSGRQSQNTSTSFGEIGSADDTCDLDLPPGITEEDVQEMRAIHRSRDPDRMTGRQGLREHQDRVAERVELNFLRAIRDRML